MTIARFGRFGTALILLALAQTVFLALFVAGRVAILRSGETVMLKSEPIDPRDLFRGDYVTLGYAISRLSLDGLAGEHDFEPGDTVYVEIAPAGETWLAAGVYRNRPDPAAGNRIIRGRIVHVLTGVPRTQPAPRSNEMEEIPCPGCRMAVVAYGIESYFVPEGEGRALEEARNLRALTVEVALARDGEAAIKRLILDGKPLYTEPLL